MRQIKFRAWDTFTKEMQRVEKISFVEWLVTCKETERNSFSNLRTDRHILMQYTSLKDKNGKDIYEGDILERVDYPNQKPQYIVKFGEFEDTPDHYHVLEQIGWYVEEIGYQDEFNNSLAYIVNDLDGVVCGNIYENKELLEEVE